MPISVDVVIAGALRSPVPFVERRQGARSWPRGAFTDSNRVLGAARVSARSGIACGPAYAKAALPQRRLITGKEGSLRRRGTRPPKPKENGRGGDPRPSAALHADSPQVVVSLTPILPTGL